MSEILLGMSGGIDSSVAAWILKRDAHEVVGVTLRFHDSPQRTAAIERAQNCAQALGIEHLVIDMREQFAQTVKEETARQFAQGLFPNPCTICTRDIKMAALFEQADALGCEQVATGHYARVTSDTTGFQLLPYQLRKPLDKSKDQTFLLYTLSQEQLARLVFPLEDLHKGVVRRMAMRAGLMRIAPVNDGQGEPCFYDDEGFVAWLEGEGGLERDAGDIVYLSDNSVIDGYEGQYRFAPDAPLGSYAIRSDLQNETDVSDQSVSFSEEELFAVYKDVAAHRVYAATRAVAGAEMCLLRDVRWTSIEPPEGKRSCRARIAYDRKPVPAQVVCKEEGVVVAFSERVGGIRSGQPIVLYSDDLVLGGGIVAG
ncbi:MAG: aminomethyltransferase beta-barrel domain-containing protein [Coriobacteriales bacterium]